MTAASGFSSEPSFERIKSQVEREFAKKPQVAFLGRTGAGKTQLLTRLSGDTTLVEESTSQPTRSDLLGCEMLDNVGAGSFQATAEDMIQHGRKADVVVYLINGMDATHDDDAKVIHALRKAGRPLIVTITKIDKWEDHDRRTFLAKAEAKLDLPTSDLCLVSSTRDIGLIELAQRIRDCLPEHLRKVFVSMIGLQELKRRECEHEMRISAGIAAAIGAIPIPVSDIFFLTPLQARLVLRIAAIYGEPLTRDRGKELAAVIGAGLVLRTIGGSLAKLIPVLGSVVAATLAASGTYAMGRAAVVYFESGMTMTDAQLQEAFHTEFESAKSIGKELAEQADNQKTAAIQELERRHKSGELTDDEFRQEINKIFFPD